MKQSSRSWRCIDWSFHFVIWRKVGNHTCKIEVIAGFSLWDLKVKRLAFNTGTRFDAKTTICRKKIYKNNPVIGTLGNLNYQIFTSETTNTSIWRVRVPYRQSNFHLLRELSTTMVSNPLSDNVTVTHRWFWTQSSRLGMEIGWRSYHTCYGWQRNYTRIIGKGH